MPRGVHTTPLVVEPAPDGNGFRVSGHDEPHLVTGQGEHARCDCKAFEYRKPGQSTCKHLAAVWSYLQRPADPVAPAVAPDLQPGLQTDVPLPEPEHDVDTPPIEPLVPRLASNPIVGAIPRNVTEDEAAVLGGILIAGEVSPPVRARLHPTAFQREGHRLIYASMVALSERGDKIDPHTLRAALDGNLDRAGGMEYLATLIDVVPGADHIQSHVSLILEHHRHRSIVQLANELATDRLSPPQVRAAIAQLQELTVDASARARFRPLSVDELLALQLPRMLLARYLVAGGSSVLIGAPGSGKSFVVLGWNLCVTLGLPWIDCETIRGGVVYVAAEGSSGLGRRVRAFSESHGIADLAGIQFVTEPVNLLEPRDVDALIAATSAARPVLFTFDTLGRCMMGGDENSPEDMGRVVAAVDRIRHATAAHVLLVHHVGWSTNDRPRGHSSLMGAADAVFLLENDAGALTLKFSKPHKDAPPIEPLQLRLVPIGESCVVEPQDSLQAIVQLEKNDRLALEALNSIDAGDGATHGDWKAAAREDRHGKSQMSPASFSRSLTRLSRAGLTLKDQRTKRYRLTGKGISACAVS